MARVTANQVKSVISTSLDDITLFMEAAEILVNENLSDKGFSADRLEKIELFLSAHFIAMSEPQLKSEKMGDSTDTYFGVSGFNILSSLYGQSAAMLDTSGTLTGLGSVRAFFEAL